METIQQHPQNPSNTSGVGSPITSVLRDEATVALLKLNYRTGLNWQDYLQIKIPHGLSVNDTWELIHAYNEATSASLESLLPDYSIFQRCTLDNSRDIAGFSQTLHRIARTETYTELMSSHILKDGQIYDTINCARLDGLTPNEDVIRHFLESEKTSPSRKTHLSVSDYYVVNALRELKNAKTYANQPIDGTFLLTIAHNIAQGITPEQSSKYHSIRLTATPCKVDPLANMAWSFDTKNDALQQRADAVANVLMRRYDDYQIGLTNCLLAPDLINTYLPLGCIGSLTGKVVQTIMAWKLGEPIVSLLQLNIQRLRWETGIGEYANETLTRRTLQESQEHEIYLRQFDLTALLSLNCTLALNEAKRIYVLILEAEKQNVGFEEALANSSIFNHRQREIITHALKGIDGSFTVYSHQKRNGISFSTARRDIAQLKAGGYIVCKLISGTNHYMPAPDISQRISADFGTNVTLAPKVNIEQIARHE